ncbi:M1 family aminopeptidase [Ferruginibacter sp.]
MKKCYPFLALLVLLCKVSGAQTQQPAKFIPSSPFAASNALNKYAAGTHHNSLPASSVTISPEATYFNKKSSQEAFEAYCGQSEALVPSTGLDYDVKYYRIELRINPDTSVGNYVKGKVTTYFKTTAANFAAINLDMVSALICDSVYYHGAKVAAGNITRPTDLVKIVIPNIPSAGTLDSVSVYYKGVPPAVPGMAGTGYVTTTHSSGPVRNYVYTLSEPYSAYTWWPCKSFIVSDKADSMDMYVSTPTGFKAAGNGKLMYETTAGGSVNTYWKERYPISSYQVCVAVANYVQYPTVADTVTLSGVKMPVYNYIFPETNTAAAQTSLNRVPLMVTTYSALYGDYPFKNEKYGNYSFGFGGGMEHNTFSGESTSGVYTAAGNWDVLAHELAHQWWGDNVTCGSWHDIWLNESFADFSEAILLEYAPTIATSVGKTAVSWRATKKTNSISASYQAKTTYVTDTSDILTIFTPSVYIYDRGGMIISMLRTLMGDTKFFQGLKNYQSDPLLKLGNGFTADIKRNLENASGLDLTSFFSQWLYNTGYAKYNGAQWNNSGNNIVLKLPQTIQSSSVTHFDMPVVVRIQGSVPATQDTTVIVYDNNNILFYDNNGVLTSTGTNLINYRLSFTPVTISFDANSQTLSSSTGFTKNTGLPVTLLATQVITFNGVKENNTAKLSWSIDNSVDYSSFEIQRSADGINFQTIGSLRSTDFPINTTSFSFTDPNILPGNGYYRINILEKNGNNIYTKIIVISNKADNYYTISPNPASKYFVINSNTVVKEIVDINIYDASGRKVKSLLKQTLNINSSLQVSVEDLGIGNYFVEVLRPNASRFTKQISVIR